MAKTSKARGKRGRSRTEFIAIYGPALLLTIAGFMIAYQFVEPAPPQRITIATGSPAGAYHGFGEAYRAILARDGIDLVVRETAGSVENVGLLGEGAVDAAFVQSGVDGAAPAELRSLGSLYFEPLWVFTRRKVSRLADLAGRRLAIGEEGSGTRAVALQLLADNGMAAAGEAVGRTKFLPLSDTEAAGFLEVGEIDAAFLIAAANAPVVRRLLESPDLYLMDFRRAEAYARRHHFLSRVVLPEAVIDFAAEIPARDVTLLAPAANLVVREDFHPALVDLLLGAATEVHGEGGLFERPGEFPSKLYTDFPLHKTAARYLEKGPPFLRNYLPFWAANLVERFLVLLVPLLTLLIPLFRIVPPTYRWRVRKKIYRWYREVQAVEDMAGEGGHGPAELSTELDRIEAEVKQLSVPLSYTDELFHLRAHIELIRGKLPTAGPAAPGEAVPS